MRRARLESSTYAVCLLALAACVPTFRQEGDSSTTSDTSGNVDGGDMGDGDGDGDGANDDGANDDGDPLAPPECGNGIQESGEECDDGNESNDDSCVEGCTLARCGDGFTQLGIEQCDDANDIDTDACVSCTLAHCGDGVVHDGVEECDDGNDVGSDDCVPGFCNHAVCGDGFVREGLETCDDGNDDDTDDCPTNCQTATCGDGFIQAGVEQCDDEDPQICDESCQSNGIYYEGNFTHGEASPEQCDDWTSWRDQVSQANVVFSRVAMRSSADPVGIECEGPKANEICQGLGAGEPVSVLCEGRLWKAGLCAGGNSYELKGSNSLCLCSPSPGNALSPCRGNALWGGVGTHPCNAPSQTIEVVCE